MRTKKLRDIEEKERRRELKKRQKRKAREISEKRRPRNREYTLVSCFFVLIFVSMIGYLIYFNYAKSDDFINSPYNTRQDTFSDRVVRGKIISADGQVLAQTNVYEDGTEERTYPYANMFAHVVGYDTNGKSGLESEANFQLLTSHEFFLNQMKNEFKNQKNTGDSVITTLNADLQSTAYNALGDRRGAVVAIEPSTGKILVEMSRPDFDPNTISQNWDTLVNDSNDSSLLNRATNGAYPPGSTFKVVTALDYFRTKGSLEGFSYLCEGSITREDHTIRCYGGTVHGQEDFYSAFANSCNSAFAEIGTMLGGSSLKKTAEDLLFNKSLPLSSYKKSTFTLNGKSSVAEVMQTAIGQGNTLVSPMHMALITSAIANDGVDVAGITRLLRAQRHADRDGDALTERTRRRIHAGALLHVRMPLQDAMQLTEMVKLLASEIAAFAQRAIERGSRVTLRQHKAVAVRILVVLGVNALHDVKIQRNERFRCGQRSAGMARTRLVGHNDDVPPHLTADLLEFLNIHQSTSSISDPAPPLLTMPQYFIIFIIAAFCRVVNLSCAKFVKRVANGTQSTRISMPAGTAP